MGFSRLELTLLGRDTPVPARVFLYGKNNYQHNTSVELSDRQLEILSRALFDMAEAGSNNVALIRHGEIVESFIGERREKLNQQQEDAIKTLYGITEEKQRG
jgi:hypothetical protein